LRDEPRGTRFKVAFTLPHEVRRARCKHGRRAALATSASIEEEVSHEGTEILPQPISGPEFASNVVTMTDTGRSFDIALALK